MLRGSSLLVLYIEGGNAQAAQTIQLHQQFWSQKRKKTFYHESSATPEQGSQEIYKARLGRSMSIVTQLACLRAANSTRGALELISSLHKSLILLEEKIDKMYSIPGRLISFRWIHTDIKLISLEIDYWFLKLSLQKKKLSVRTYILRKMEEEHKIVH